jgi:hypothetical protein
MKTMNVEQLDGLEIIDPKPMCPWSPPAFVEIDIEPDRDKAKDEATAASPGIAVYSDASGRNNHLGTVAVQLNENQEVMESRQLSLGPMTNWSVHAAELIGIFYAISLVLKTVNLRPTAATTPERGKASLGAKSFFAYISASWLMVRIRLSIPVIVDILIWYLVVWRQ